MPADPRRRSVLAATAMTLPLLAAGCKGIGALGTPPKPLPDVAVLRDAIAGEKLMIDRYRSAMSGSPGLAKLLGPLLAQHEAHLARLRSRLIEPTGSSEATSAPSASRSAAHSPGTGTPAAAGTPAGPIAVLAAAEDRAAATLVSHLQLVTPSLAQLLTSIAASEATHALVLRSRRRAG